MISVKEMYGVDKKAQEKGISVLQLMENAGSNTARILNEFFPLGNKKVLFSAEQETTAGTDSALQGMLLFMEPLFRFFLPEKRLKYEAMKPK